MPIKPSIVRLLSAAFYMLASTGLNAQDKNTVSDVEWLRRTALEACSFDTSAYKQVTAEFYLASIAIEGGKIKGISLRDEDKGAMRLALLKNLQNRLVGYKLKSHYLPEKVFLPILLLNPLTSSHGGVEIAKINQIYNENDVSLLKNYWLLQLTTYRGLARWQDPLRSQLEDKDQ